VLSLPFISFFIFEVDKKRGSCSYVPSIEEEIRPTQFFFKGESSDSFYLEGGHFKVLDLKMIYLLGKKTEILNFSNPFLVTFLWTSLTLRVDFSLNFTLVI